LDLDFGFALGLELVFVRELVLLGPFLDTLGVGVSCDGDGEEEVEVDPGEVLRLLNDDGGALCGVEVVLEVEAEAPPRELGGSDFDLVGRGGIDVGVVALGISVVVAGVGVEVPL